VNDIAVRTRAHLIGAWIGLAFALGLGVIRLFGERSPVHAAEWWIADLALAGVVAFPAVLALMGTRRPALLLAAAIASFPLAFISFAALPLLAPVVFYLIAYRRLGGRGGSIAIAIALCASLASLGLIVFVPGQIVCWHETVYDNGRTTLTRDRASEEASSSSHFSGSGGPPRRGVVSEESGCTEGAIRPPVSMAALGLVSLGVLSSRRLSEL
jgi:hypothetical protein